MACSRREDSDGGYATPAAVAISLALALTVTALTGAGTAELRLARADLRRMQAEYKLAGAHTAAVVSMLSSSQSGRLRWNMSASGVPVEVLAEPEAGKLTLDRASNLEDGRLEELGAAAPERAKVKLKAGAGRKARGRALVQAADAAPLWRACALSAISPYGAADIIAISAAEELRRSDTTSWRAGEVWRVRVNADGWADDRIVRFTGDPRRPAAVVERDFGRAASGGEPCRALIEASEKA